MKFLKIALGIILLLVLFFFAKGLLTPTVEYDCIVTVNKSADESWAIMSDQSKMSQWIKGFKRSELESGTENTVGAVSHVYVDEGGAEMMMEETIVEINPGEQLKMNFSMDMMNMDYEIKFNEENGKTVITTNSSTEGNGLLYKSVISFMRSAMKAQEEENLNSLKKLIEDNMTDYFPAPEILETVVENN